MSETIIKIPDDPNTMLTRDKTSQALTERGYPTAVTTLATLATRGGGPIFRHFGKRPLYRWGDALSWAEARLSSPRRSTSDRD